MKNLKTVGNNFIIIYYNIIMKMFTFVVLALIIFCALYYGSNILVIDDTINSMGSFMVTTTEGFTKYEKMPSKYK